MPGFWSTVVTAPQGSGGSSSSKAVAKPTTDCRGIMFETGTPQLRFQFGETSTYASVEYFFFGERLDKFLA